MSYASGAVFFDRDGTLNRSALAGEYIRSSGELELLPEAATAVSRVNAVGLPAILVTNQRWLSAPGGDFDVYSRIEAKLARLLAAEGAKLDACYTCPHALGICTCRKPLPGLLLRAAKQFAVSLADSYFIGDSASDVQAGLAVGATTILITHASRDDAAWSPDHIVGSIAEAVDLVLGEIAIRRLREVSPSPPQCA